MNKSGLDKHNRGTDFLNRIEKYSDLVSLEDALFAVGVAVQEALAKQKERIKKIAGDWYYNEVYVEDLILDDLLSALDHLEEGK